MVRGGEGRVGTRDLRRSSRTPHPVPLCWGTTRLRLCGQQHQKHCRLISVSRAELSWAQLVRHQDALHCQTAPPTGHQLGARIPRCSPRATWGEVIWSHAGLCTPNSLFQCFIRAWRMIDLRDIFFFFFHSAMNCSWFDSEDELHAAAEWWKFIV